MTAVARVVLPGVLREHVEGEPAELSVALDGDATVAALLDSVAAQHPRLGRRLRDETGALRRHVNLFIDGDDVRGIGGLQAPVGDGCVVHVLPAVSGG
jgi:molybdopterin converting factor small subunit